MFRDLRINKIPIFEREGWQSQPSLSKIGILFSCKSLTRLVKRGIGRSHYKYVQKNKFVTKE